MGIRLDWEIEAEQEHKQQSAGEDPETRRKRRRARLRFLLLLVVLLALVGTGVALVLVRLRQVEDDSKQVLQDTVAAEVAALRLGDRDAFLEMQRSATDEWSHQQDASFDRYQALKQTDSLNLSGRVIDTAIDGNRGRVEVEEIIDGIPYGKVWFYWHYPDGWRHVPPDYTFWGEARTASAPGVQVRYRTVDEALAQVMAQRVSNWLRVGCAALVCGDLPTVNVEIVPTAAQEVGWSASDPWTLQIPSPSATSVRLDAPFDSGTQIKAATLLADRLVGTFNPTYPADAYYLKQGIISWLVKRFAEVETNSFLIGSIADHYGDPAVGQLLQIMQPDSPISVIGNVTGTTLDAAPLDWRDFLTWRLALENELITRQDEGNYLALYDTGNTTVRDQAYARYAAGASGDPRTVISATSQPGSDGTPELHAVVQVGNPQTSQEEVIFRLVNGVWKRAS